jgi:diguanylate cyclase (GGDEF)-like protein
VPVVTRFGRILFLAAFVVVVGAAAWVQFTGQRTQADDASSTTAAVAAVFDTVVQVENAARDYTVARDTRTLDAFTTSGVRLTAAIERAGNAVDDTALHAQLVDELALVDSWRAAVDHDVTAVTAGDASGGGAERAASRGAQLTRIRIANDALLRGLHRQDRDERDEAGIRGLLVVVGCCVLFAILNWLLFARSERRDAGDRDRQLAFADRLQGARSEEEARTLLARHLEQVAPDAIALVTGPDDASDAGRPVTSGGERVGTVILRSDRDLAPRAERLVHDSILRAGPVLATLRTLAVAQARAATDPLTGLGNRRLVEDALGRMVAQARRTNERFAVAVVDLDRFKLVNDTHGHGAGDELLVAVARVLDHATREYDVVGRQGGDEFMVLLAGLDGADAETVMERCRAAIADVRIGDPPVGATASVGVATSRPGETADPVTIVRAADDAVYAAKARGGNCVVAVTVTDAGTPEVGTPGVGAQASALRA